MMKLQTDLDPGFNVLICLVNLCLTLLLDAMAESNGDAETLLIFQDPRFCKISKMNFLDGLLLSLSYSESELTSPSGHGAQKTGSGSERGGIGRQRLVRRPPPNERL